MEVTTFRKRNQYKTKSLTIATYCIFIAIFRAQGLPTFIQYAIQIFSLFAVIVHLITKNRGIHKNNISFVFSCAIFASTLIAYFHNTTSIKGVFSCAFYSFCLVLFYEILDEWAKYNEYRNCILKLWYIDSVYCIITIFSVLAQGTSNSETTIYVFGGKFSCSYLFILLICLTYFLSNSKKKNRYLWNSIYLIVIAISLLFFMYIKCTTALVMLLLIVFLSIAPQRIRYILSSAKVVIGFIILSALVIFFLQKILSIDIVKNIIVNILGKSLTLTSRTPIYEKYLFPLILSNPIWGYGHSSSILRTFTPYWNAQNGLFEIMLNYGLVGVISFIYTSFHCLKKANTSFRILNGWWIYILIYSFILAATIEISYDYMFLIALLIIDRFGDLK